MKKITGTIIGILAIAAVVFILAGNRKKALEQTRDISMAEGRESVTVFTVRKEAFSRSFTSNAVAQAGSELNFVSEVSGRVVEVFVDEGSRVTKGTPLLKIDAELLEADYNAAIASYESLKKDEERFARSFEAGGVTSQQLDNIRTQLVAAGSRLTVSKWKYDNAVVKSPVAGTVNMRYVDPGALIAPNAPLFEIVDDSHIKAVCNVPESRVRMLSTGQSVTAKAADAASGTFAGRIKSIGVKTDRGLNFPVEVAFERSGDLHVGMYLNVSFASDRQSEGILIPRKAVVGSVLSANVYVVEDGIARKREVSLGDMFSDRIEILDGLAEGDNVILSGLMNVADGKAVKVVGE